MKSVLLLGGSRQQVLAIEKAKELGYRTVLCDYLPDNPGQYVADVFYQASTTDKDAILEVARREKVDGVLAYASDPAAPTAAYVAQELGLPGNPLESVETLSEKHLLRAFLREHGFPCPRAASFSINASDEDVLSLVEGWRWPIVVKPTDSSGSKGVSIVKDKDDLPAAIECAGASSRNGTLICEEYIRKTFPYVIGGDIFVQEGEVRFWGLMSCLRDERLGGLVPTGKFFTPGLNPAQLEAIKRVLQDLVSALGIRFGELNVEVIVGEDGVPYVLELGARAGGNMIPVQLSDASGIDLVAANVLCAMGEDPGDLCFDGEGTCCAHVVLHSAVSGIFSGVSYSDIAHRCVYREVLYVEPGDAVEAFGDAGKAVGIAFLQFENEKQMHEILSQIDAQVSVHVEVEP